MYFRAGMNSQRRLMLDFASVVMLVSGDQSRRLLCLVLLGSFLGGACHSGGVRPVGAGTGGTDGGQPGGNDGGQLDGGDAGKPPPPCNTTADCRAMADLTPSHLCWRGSCVDLRNADCPLIQGVDELPGEPLVMGVISGVDLLASGTLPLHANLKLVLHEFFALGVPVGTALRRPVVLLCEGTGPNRNQLDRSLDHLIDFVGVPAIAMVTNGDDIHHAAQRTLVAGKRVLFLDFGGPAARLRDLPDEGLVWHMLGDPTQVAPTFVPLVERVETLVNRDAPPVGSSPTRVAFVVDSSRAFDAEIADLLRQTLRFNGRVGHDPADDDFEIFTASQIAANPIFNISPSQPHIVVALADPFLVDFMIGEMEQHVTEQRFRPPFYVLSPDSSHFPPLQERIRGNRSLQTRVLGVNFAAAADPSVYEAYLARLLGGSPGVPGLEGTENFYDMLFLLFHAAAAADPTPPFDGLKLAAGLRRLTDVAAPSFQVGPDDMDDIFARLREPTATLRLEGTLGPADFDQTTGVARIGGSVWCLREDGSYAYDVLRFNRVTQDLDGTVPCFMF
jgi:hypothetical protein